jgi:TRAP-type C4-dicarboxylate transport system permease small subunit
MKNEKISIQSFLTNFEIYLATICFFMLMFMLTGQVLSRYILRHSWTWMEEVATFIFVWMCYFGIAGAVTKRKHLRIDFVLEMLPFKIKRMFLIFSNVVFAAFNIYIYFIMLRVLKMLGKSVMTMTRLPKKSVYIIIPAMLLLTVVRLVQDTIKLTGETERNLGASKPSLDLDAAEKEYQDELAASRKGGVI